MVEGCPCGGYPRGEGGAGWSATCLLPSRDSAPQILGHEGKELNWANVRKKVPRRFWGTKEAGSRGP